MKKQALWLRPLLWFALIFYGVNSHAQVPSYYNGTDITQTGTNLKADISALITSTHTTSLVYTPGVWDALKQTDLDPTNSNNVLLIYGYDDTDTAVNNDRTRGKDLNGGNVGEWNREHTFPKSLGNPNLGTSGPGSDAHHLRPSDVQFNSSRSNRQYADGNGNAGIVGSNWYPGDEWKVDVARMMMYMYLRYSNRCLPVAVGTGTQNFHPDMMDIFLEWNAEDPVTQFEINRNVLLEGIQGNRNPFIDNPAFATSIWGGPQAEDRFNNTSTDTEAPTIPANLIAVNTTQTQTELLWDASTDNVGVIAYQVFNGVNQITSVTTTNYAVTGLTPNTSYNFTVKAIDAASNTSAESNTANITTLEDTTPPSDFIAFQGYEGTSNDTWNFNVNPVTCNDGGNDVWDIVSSVGSISSANTDTNFFGVRDLEGNCGTSSGGTIAFNSIDITGFESVILTFSLNVVGYDVGNGDTISYEIFHDNVSQGLQIITVGSPFSTTGWEQISQTIPDTVASVRFTIAVKQNGGSDYAGFDDVQLQGTAISTTPAIVINEVDADTPGADTLEFLELYDGGAGNSSLDGMVIVMYNGSNNLSYGAYDLDGQTTNAQGYFVLGNTAVANADMILPSNGLQNGADAVAIYTGDAADFPNGTAVTTNNLIDALVYDTNDGDDAELLVLLNAVEAQVNEGGAGDKDNHSSQRVPNGLGGVRNTATYGQFTPTPGAQNGEVIPAPEIVINEVDADTPGSDTLEFLELYDGGAGNSSLDGLVVVMYNGSNNLSYGAYDLDGQTTNAQGYFVLGNTAVTNADMILPSNGLQNGADAVAIYTGDATDFPNGTAVITNNLIDALVYDTNDGDDAELLVLLNTGEVQVNEGGAGDKDNHSSQRVPNGAGGARNTATYGQFAPTPGVQNGEVIPAPEIVINEVDADTPGSDTLEFLELYDGGVGNSSLDGLVIVMYNGSNNLSYGAYDLDGQTTNAQGYFVLGNTAVANADMILPSNGLQNGADAVAIYTGDAVDFPNGTAVTTNNLIDALVYDTNDADDAELLVLLNTGEGQVNEGGAGDKDNHSSQRFANGSGGARNTASYVQAIPTPGGVNTNATAPISLVINEVDADTAGSDTLEFVELFDGGTGNTSLDGFVLVVYNGNNDTSYNAYDLDGQTTNAEGYFVLGNTAVLNVDMILPSNGLQNGADAVALYTGNATDFPNGTTITTSNLIDALVYDTNDADDAELLVLLNAGQAQINEGELGDKDGHSSQRIPNGAGGARNTATYTQATPTPGTENGAIITPPDAISILEARNATVGELVTISGVLTVSDQFSGSAYIQDATGGIAIFDEQVHGDGVFMIGDSITVSGMRSVFNEQIQIGTVISVVNNGIPNQAITSLTINLSELVNHPAELVRIVDPSFPAPGDILFGNSNYLLSDVSGDGQLRIDNDVDEIVGLGQPQSCSEIIGVVGRFFTTHQLLPRSSSDMSCAGPYVPPTPPINVPKDKTFDVVTWNIEWFGDEQNSPPAGNPMSDTIQKDSAKAVILSLDADIYAVEEISDDVLFAQMVNELPGYAYILSPAVSRPNDPGVKQKVGFIYNTATVNVIETKVLLESIHPLYNGGDDSALVGYPSSTDRFYATGRLPFLMTADITIEGQTEQYNIVALHARANRGTDAQNRYDMRKYDVEVLKDSLDVHYPNTNLILLGDYNDDVDVTVADIPSTLSSFDSYVTDTQNYTIVTRALSDAGLRSFVFRENMIDHITITDELDDNYINQSVRVHYEFYDSDYPFTTSDHFPVSARFQLSQLALAGASSTEVSCNGEADGTATVSVSGGIAPYSYDWSNGQTTATATGLVAGSYNVIIMDALGNGIVQEYTISEPIVMVVTTSENTTMYNGYPDQSCTTISVTGVTGGIAPYTYEWGNGITDESQEVCPDQTTTYTVTITDVNGCSVIADIQVEVIDVQCGNNPNHPKVQICHRGRSICIPRWAVQSHLNHGDTLGSCDDSSEIFITNLRVYPNPFRKHLNFRLNVSADTDVNIEIYNLYGHRVFHTQEQLSMGSSTLGYDLGNLRQGLYYLKIFIGGELKKVKVLIKH